MTANQLIVAAIRILFALLAAITVYGFARRPDAARRDIMLMFLSVAIALSLPGIARPLGVPNRYINLVALPAILFHPYLVLRLANYYRPGRRIWRILTLIGYPVSIASVVVLSKAAPYAGLGVMSLYFVIVDTGVAVMFVRGAADSGGVTRKRLTFAAAGSISLGLLFGVLILLTVFAVSKTLLGIVVYTVAAAAAVGYYLGFAPPRWLRTVWQHRELVRLFRTMSQVGPEATVDEVGGVFVDTIRRVVANAKAVAIVLGESEAEGPARLLVRKADGERARFDVPNEVFLHYADAADTRIRDDVRQTQRRRKIPTLDSALSEVARLVDAEYADVVPLASAGGRHAILLAFLARQTLFRDDNFEILRLIADYAAQVIDIRTFFLVEHSLREELERAVVLADAANRAKTDFLANMSHELRTPLNSIIGFSDLLIASSSETLSEKQIRYLNNISGSGHHLLNLINDILDLSKIEAGKMTLAPGELYAPAMMRDVIAVVEPLAKSKSINIEVAIADDIPVVVADSGKVHQIMYNLLSNSIKFTPPGGRVRVSADSGVWTDAQGNKRAMLNVEVADTGIGIKAVDLPRLFGKFEQLDSTYARKQEGTGLGLALTRRLVEMHGGTITAYSAGEGAGSTFTVRLPLRPEESVTPAGVLDDSERTNGRKVLVIEDDPRAQELISLYLAEAGFGYHITADANQAFDYAIAHNPVAMTLDIILPNANGWELLRKLKLDERTRNIPVFVISVTADRDLGLSLGAAEFFLKPISGPQLLDALARHLDPGHDSVARNVGEQSHNVNGER